MKTRTAAQTAIICAAGVVVVALGTACHAGRPPAGGGPAGGSA